MSKTKPYSISKNSVVLAWKSVKANKGTFGVDEETIVNFEKKLKDNLYKVWNRMSSGTYFPTAVKAVEIPKPGGQTRELGIPTVMDRVAQAIAKLSLEPLVEPKFHEDSYGYRPKKSALEAVGVTKKRCWQSDWVIDLDIKGFFDNLDHELMMKAVRFHTKEKWILLYVDRWLKAPIQQKGGQVEKQGKGTPQGGVISPLLANIFMHHAFDDWMKKYLPDVQWARYADDVVAHCKSREQAKEVLEKIEKRLRECKLELHPEKTKIVYCKDYKRKGSYEHEQFGFLGYTFKARSIKSKYGGAFLAFIPAMSKEAAKRIRQEIQSWQIRRRSDESLKGLAERVNPKVQGWINYYGRYCKSALGIPLETLESSLIRWSMRKYKKLRCSRKRAKHWLKQIRQREPELFAHWKASLGTSAR